MARVSETKSVLQAIVAANEAPPAGLFGTVTPCPLGLEGTTGEGVLDIAIIASTPRIKTTLKVPINEKPSSDRLDRCD